MIVNSPGHCSVLTTLSVSLTGENIIRVYFLIVYDSRHGPRGSHWVVSLTFHVHSLSESLITPLFVWPCPLVDRVFALIFYFPSEITPEGRKQTKLSQTLLNGNNICMVCPLAEDGAACFIHCFLPLSLVSLSITVDTRKLWTRAIEWQVSPSSGWGWAVVIAVQIDSKCLHSDFLRRAERWSDVDVLLPVRPLT